MCLSQVGVVGTRTVVLFLFFLSAVDSMEPPFKHLLDMGFRQARQQLSVMLGGLSNVEGQHGPAPVTSEHVTKERAEHEEGEEDGEGLLAQGIATKVSRLLPCQCSARECFSRNSNSRFVFVFSICVLSAVEDFSKTAHRTLGIHTSVVFWRNSKTLCYGRWRWPNVGRCSYLVRGAPSNEARAASQRSRSDRGGDGAAVVMEA